MTRLALAVATNDDPAEAYRRNVFAMGPGYTYFNLLPRLLYEQSKEGSWAQSAGIVGDVVQRLQYVAPYSVPVAPKSRSQLESANRDAFGASPLPTTAPEFNGQRLGDEVWAKDFRERLQQFNGGA